MKALVFAAGRGERMRPLSDVTPKPLLPLAGRPLIVWQIEALVRAGIREIVVNTAHLAPQIELALGDGVRHGVHIRYSHEGDTADDALETLGGIVKALPLLGAGPFIAVSGDIYCDYDYRHLLARGQMIELGVADAHLVLVDNPPYHPSGDMGLDAGRVSLHPPLLTYANIGVFAPRLFDGESVQKKKLFPWMYQHVSRSRVTGERFTGVWHNLGTPEELAALDASLRAPGPAENAGGNAVP
jgi:MurNAc alpha-1-phosphate uridylyltransferase